MDCTIRAPLGAGAEWGRRWSGAPRALFAALLILAGLLLTPGVAGAAVFNVTGTGDGTGPCTGSSCPTLRSAVLASNAAGGSNTINLAAGTYTLTLTPTGPDDGMTGDLEVTANVTIAGVGAGSGGTAIVGSGDRVLDISASAVTLSDMSISGGSGQVSGGAISDVGGSMTLTRDSVHDNTTTPGSNGFGGAIDMSSAAGALTITSSTFDSNAAQSASGANGGGFGGAIMFEPGGTGTMDITNSTFDSNTAQSGSGMSTGGFGGAIMFQPGATGTLTITGSTFSANASAGSGTNSGGFGGAIMFQPGATGTLTITGSTFSANASAGSGTNSGGFGGAIMFQPSTDPSSLGVSNSTFTGNHADGQSGFGGAIMFQPNGATSSGTLTNDTIVGNSATGTNEGGGILVEDAPVTIENSILSGNTAAGASSNCTSTSGGTLQPQGHNVELGTSCGFDINADPMVAALADNGGPTKTMALVAGSPAIDAAAPAFCPATDQRGVARPDDPGTACDLGAFEFQHQTTAPPPPPPALRPTSTVLVCNYVAVRFSFRCFATVRDLGPAPTVPATGQVTFGLHEGGSFIGGSSCTLLGPPSGASPSCSVDVLPPATGAPMGTATYGGDAAHTGNSSTISLHIITLGTEQLISSLEIVPASLLAAPSGPAFTSRPVFGATVRYTLRAPALVRFTAQARTVGRKGRGGRCAAPNRRNRRHRACTRFATRPGSFALIGSKGQNHFRFTGRIGGKSLTPGSYQLVATPSILGVTGTPATRSFRIKRSKPRAR